MEVLRQLTSCSAAQVNDSPLLAYLEVRATDAKFKPTFFRQEVRDGQAEGRGGCGNDAGLQHALNELRPCMTSNMPFSAHEAPAVTANVCSCAR